MLRLYVWEECLCDYGAGIMFALAHNIKEARSLIKNKMKLDFLDKDKDYKIKLDFHDKYKDYKFFLHLYRVNSSLSGKPLIIKEPVAYYMVGSA